MWIDPIVEELHAARREMAVQVGGSTQQIAEFLLRKQREFDDATRATQAPVASAPPYAPPPT